MSSEIPNIEELELISSDSKSTYEGTVWISLQAVEHTFNNISQRDSFTNNYMPSYLTDKLDRFNILLLENSLRPFPQDELFQLIRFSKKALQKILENPKSKLYKEEKFIHAYKVKSLDSKAMTWLGKQSGRTFQEKIASKNKILCKEKRYTYETKENQITAKFINMLISKMRNRLEVVNTDCYDTFQSDCERWDEFEEFQNFLESRFKKSHLSDVGGSFDFKPNNVLINDRNYSVIWRAYKQLVNYNTKFKEDWEMVLDRFRSCIFYGIISELYTIKNIYIADKLVLTKDLESKINFFYDDSQEIETPLKKIKMLLFQGKKIPSIEIDLELSGSIINILVDNRTNKKKINYIIKKKEKIQPSKNRGMEVVINKIIQGSIVKGWEFKSYSDMKGLKNIIKKIVDEILIEIKSPRILKKAKVTDNSSSKCVGIDFTSYTPEINSEGERIFRYMPMLYGIESLWNEEKNISLRKEDTFYDRGNKIIPMRDIFTSESSATFTKVVEFLQHNLKLEDEEYFCYVVPDTVDEFSQKLLKASIIPYFKKSFPVWRSIAAAIWWNKTQNFEISNGDDIVVIDTHGERISMVKLRAIAKDSEIIFEHYPVFSSDDLDSELSYDSFMRKYLHSLSLSLDEDEVEMILNLGIVDSVIKEKSYKIFYNGEKNIIIEYRKNLYEKLAYNWLENLKKYLKTKSMENNVSFKYELFLGDFLPKENFVIKSENTAEGASEISKRLKTGKVTWFEYLPDLSLEITRNGHYGELAIVKNKTIIPSYGEEIIINVEENMILNKGNKYYRFPLIKQENSKNEQDIRANITSKLFPLQKDVGVRLEIKYIYGLENSYELQLIALSEDAPFKTLAVDWIGENVIEHKVELKMPNQEVLDDSELKKEISWISKRFMQLIRKFSTVYGVVEIIDYISKIKNRIRKLAGSNSDVIKSFMTSEEMLEFLYNLFKLFEDISQNKEKYSEVDFGGKNPTDSIIKFFCSFGKYAQEELIIECFGKNKRIDYIGLLISGNYRTDMAEKLFDSFKNSNDKVKRKILEIISDNTKQDVAFLEKLFLDYPEWVKLMIRFIEKDFKILKEELKSKSKLLEEKNQRWTIKEPFRRYCELMIFLLASREKIHLLKNTMSLTRMFKLAKNIKKIDALLFSYHLEDSSAIRDKNSETWLIEPKIKIKVTKPDALRNVSDIVFVLNSNLTGEGGDNLIEITEIDEKE